MDLDVVRDRFAALRAALPDVSPYYAVKANPAPAVLRVLAGLGAGFDVASPGEVRLCMEAGAPPRALSYGNPIAKPAELAFAYEAGVRLFAVDCPGGLDAVANAAPGSGVLVRFAVGDTGSRTPFGHKFGCTVPVAQRLLARCVALGLRAAGVSFHVGSQQTDPGAWGRGIAVAAGLIAGLDEPVVNLGGGLPVRYAEPVPPLAEHAEAITSSLRSCLGARRPSLMIEPGRFLVAEAGVVRTEVVQVAQRPDGRRWVYVDVGRYNGLAECENEAIAYRLDSVDAGGPVGPVVLAGPTCDGDDVLYLRTRCELPRSLAPGDRLDILDAGAYTASYASVGFNGIPPLRTYFV